MEDADSEATDKRESTLRRITKWLLRPRQPFSSRHKPGVAGRGDARADPEAWPMAVVEHDDARIHWYEMGRGEPIVLIMGLGCPAAMWLRLAPRLARNHRVIMLDNRGSGRTEVRFFVTHRITSTARDVAAVLDAAGEQTAHVLGFSIGGVIAQQLAIAAPARLRSLILLATHCGGPNMILASPEVTSQLFSRSFQTPEQALRAMEPYVYARATPASLIEEDNAIRLASQRWQRDFEAQIYGLMSWSAYTYLPRFRIPTLVMHGFEDQLIPPDNGRLLASRIPGARLIELANASHFAHADQLEPVTDAVLEFVGDVGMAASAPGQNTQR